MWLVKIGYQYYYFWSCEKNYTKCLKSSLQKMLSTKVIQFLVFYLTFEKTKGSYFFKYKLDKLMTLWDIWTAKMYRNENAHIIIKSKTKKFFTSFYSEFKIW